MPYEPSFGTLEVEASGATRPEPGTPFAIAIFGPFSGNVADFADSEQLTQRKALVVNFDNLEEKLAEWEPRLRLSVAGTVVELEFETLDDFHVDEIFRKVYHFEDLLDLAGKLESGGSEATAEKIRAAAGSARSEPAADWSTCIPAVAELSQFRGAAVRDTDGSELPFPELAARLAGPLLAGPDATNDQLAAAVREGASSLMRQILHHPDFQALESAWRSVQWLLRLAQKSDFGRVVLFDVNAAEFAGDLAAADDLKSTAVYQMLDQFAEDRPWSVILGQYRFDVLGPHADLLGRMGKIGMRFGAPFLTSVDPRVLNEQFKADEETAPTWEALRQLPEAAFVGLGVPGFLIRPPYGEAYRPAETFEFVEYTQDDSRPYLLATSGVAITAVLLRSFLAEGWDFKAGQHLRLDSMPLHVYRDQHDDEVAVTTEQRFTSKVSQVATDLGCLPLLAIRGQDAFELAHFRSLAQEPRNIAGRWDEASGIEMVQHSRLAPVATATGTMSSDLPGTTNRVEPDEVFSGGGDDDDDSFGGGGGDDDDMFGGGGDDDDDLAALMGGDDDSEMDPELAALMGGDDSGGGDDDDMDPELAALLGGGGDDDSGGEMDPELAALLGDSGGDDSAGGGDEEMDPELAALLGDSGDPSATEGMDPELAALMGGDDAGDDAGGGEEMDPELAALLGDDTAGDAATDEMDPELAALMADADDTAEAGADADLDPELAALLGEDESPPEEEMDPELAALLGEAEAATEPAADEPAEELDPELAALMGGADEAEPPEMDPELAALLGETETPAESAETEIPKDEPDPAAEEIESESEPESEPEPEPAVAESDETFSPPGNESEAMSTDIESESLDSETPSEEVAAESEASASGSIADQVAQLREVAPWPEAGSPAILDFEMLLEPIPGDSPAGSSLGYDVREKLDEYRKEINPEDYADDDPTRPPDFVPANWTGIVELCQQTLTDSSKDLLVAARMTEALMSLHGFAGLRDGLHLMRLMLVVCWDRLVPEIEDEDDLDLRAGPFEWMDDPDRGARLPNTVKNVPILPNTQIGYFQWAQAQTGEGDVSMADFESAMVAADYADCARIQADILQCTAELQALDKTLDEKLANLSPGFSALRPALTECYTLAKQILDRKAPDEEVAEGEEGAAATGGAPGMGGGGGPRGESREDLYRQLTYVADKLQRLEPHSPIPYLVRRAVDLGSKPFPDLLRSLVRDDSIVSELSREFGIPGGDKGTESSYEGPDDFR